MAESGVIMGVCMVDVPGFGDWQFFRISPGKYSIQAVESSLLVGLALHLGCGVDHGMQRARVVDGALFIHARGHPQVLLES